MQSQRGTGIILAALIFSFWFAGQYSESDVTDPETIASAIQPASSSQSSTLQQDMNNYSGVTDNYLTHVTNQNPQANMGAAEKFQFYRDSPTSEYRTVIRFDISSLPADANISSARLELYHSTGLYTKAPMIVRAHRLGRS